MTRLFSLTTRSPKKPWLDEARALLALAWPLVLTNSIETALMSTNLAMIGALGPRTLAAAALTTNLYFGCLLFGIGLVGATSPLVARELGRKAHAVRAVRRIVRQGFWSAALIAVPMWIVLWHTDAILVAVGQEPALAAVAAGYMRVLQWSIPPLLAYLVLRSFLTALRRPVWAAVIGAMAVLVNALANWVFVFGHLGAPKLGIDGSGLATIIANVFLFAGLGAVVTLDRRFRRYRLFGRFWQTDWPQFRAFWRLGLPIGTMTAFESTIFTGSTFLMGLVGAAEVAAHAVAIQIAAVTFMLPLGIGQAVAVQVGRAHGAGDTTGIGRAGWTALALTTGFMTVTAMVMLTMPRTLAGVFIDADDPASAPVMDLAVTFLAFAALFQLADGAQAVGGGMLRGLHDTRVPMLLAAIGYLGIGLPLGAALAFVFGLGGRGIWIGLLTGLFAVAGLLIARWTWRDRFLIVGSQPVMERASA